MMDFFFAALIAAVFFAVVLTASSFVRLRQQVSENRQRQDRLTQIRRSTEHTAAEIRRVQNDTLLRLFDEGYETYVSANLHQGDTDAL